MADAGEVVARTLDAARRAAPPGRDDGRARRPRRGVHPLARRRPDVKGYRGFPAAICISPNDDDRARDPGRATALEEGDIVSFDVGVTLDGLVADSAVTFAVGEISAEAQRLLDVCQAALAAGIEQARARATTSATSPHAVQTTTEEAGFSVVRSLVGHGVGRSIARGSAGPELRRRPAAARSSPRA